MLNNKTRNTTGGTCPKRGNGEGKRYTRIEPLPGGRLTFAALEHDAKTGDGRGRTNVRSQRADSEG